MSLELGKNGELGHYGEIGGPAVSKYENSIDDMTRQAEEINAFLESIQIPNQEDNLRKQYLNAIKRLALQKIENDLLFESKLIETIKNLSSLGLAISKESMLKDIQAEINRQRMSFDLDNDFLMESTIDDGPNYAQLQIEQLKNNLGNIFESAPIQKKMKLYQQQFQENLPFKVQEIMKFLEITYLN